MKKVDVLIVGGGPAGLSAAGAIEGSASVMLVHRDREFGLPVRTSGASWGQHIKALGIPDYLCHPIRTLTFVGPGSRHHTHFGNDFPVVLDVTGTYQFLAALAREAGADLHCLSVFKTVLRQEGNRIICLITRSGKPMEISAHYVIDASGSSRRVLRSVTGGKQLSRFGVGAEYEFDNARAPDYHAVLLVRSTYCGAGYGWVFPTNRNTIRVGIGVIHPDNRQRPGPLLDDFLKSDILRELGIHLGPLRERHFGVVPADGPQTNLIQGRIVAVGDSAGQALPIVGEGIRYVVEAGRIAGKAVFKALDDEQHGAEHLHTYYHWWDRHYRRQFELAQKINLHISGYLDKKWDEKIRLLRITNGDLIAKMLRMELGMVDGLRLFLRHPLLATKHGVSRLIG